ncbi:hypothetical protein FGO68_gene4198 [Halteria grandinella]|uniref:Uncharacterized protein n=1 Tax=Halteria grandinella TaxID=5974 RepID=A0A8J8NQB9_HALGN|nr:hypothetical protein FGO68_gene4198 [Halteria grandinella]
MKPGSKNSVHLVMLSSKDFTQSSTCGTPYIQKPHKDFKSRTDHKRATAYTFLSSRQIQLEPLNNPLQVQQKPLIELPTLSSERMMIFSRHKQSQQSNASVVEEFGITPWNNQQQQNGNDSVIKFQRALNTHLQQKRGQVVRKLQSQDSLDKVVTSKKITIEDIMNKQKNVQFNERNSGGVYSPVPKSRMEPLGKLLSRNTLYQSQIVQIPQHMLAYTNLSSKRETQQHSTSRPSSIKERANIIVAKQNELTGLKNPLQHNRLFINESDHKRNYKIEGISLSISKQHNRHANNLSMQPIVEEKPKLVGEISDVGTSPMAIRSPQNRGSLLQNRRQATAIKNPKKEVYTSQIEVYRDLQNFISSGMAIEVKLRNPSSEREVPVKKVETPAVQDQLPPQTQQQIPDNSIKIPQINRDSVSSRLQGSIFDSNPYTDNVSRYDESVSPLYSSPQNIHALLSENTYMPVNLNVGLIKGGGGPGFLWRSKRRQQQMRNTSEVIDFQKVLLSKYSKV